MGYLFYGMIVLIFTGACEEDCAYEVLYNDPTDIAGFQFDISGATVTGASGGSAETADFSNNWFASYNTAFIMDFICFSLIQ